MDCPPIILILEEGGAAAVQIDWGAADFVMAGAEPAELSARLRLLRAHVPVVAEVDDDRIDVGDLVIDVTAYTARLRGSILDLTYKEFELLKFLAANRGRVLTRDALLHEVWGRGLHRRLAHGGRPYPAPARQAGHRARQPHRHGPQRRLPPGRPEDA